MGKPAKSHQTLFCVPREGLGTRLEYKHHKHCHDATYVDDNASQLKIEHLKHYL